MKKAKAEMRREYKRSDFSKLERGKFYTEAAKGAVIALPPEKLATQEITSPLGLDEERAPRHRS